MSEESGKVCLFKRAKKPQRGRGQRRRHESSDSNKSSASSDAGSDGGTNILISRNFFCQFSWILESSDKKVINFTEFPKYSDIKKRKIFTREKFFS